MQFVFSVEDHEYKCTHWHELTQCIKDPAYFIEHYCLIDHPVQGQINFNLYPFQHDMIKIMDNSVPGCAINAARQMGTSSLTCAYVLWRLLFIQGDNILSIHPKGGFKEEFMQRLMNMYNTLPEWMQPNIINQTKSELMFDNKSMLIVDRVHPHVSLGCSFSYMIIHSCELLEHELDQDLMMTNLMVMLSLGAKLLMTTCSIRTGEIANCIRVCKNSSNLSYGKFIWSDHPDRDQHYKNFQIQYMGQDAFARECECIDTIYGN